jgi:small subunit ribosomal protein S9
MLTETESKFDIFIRLEGGGVNGQAGAVRLGIARALIEFNKELRPALKSAGLLTRDSRIKERKKYGLRKARKAPQYHKR